MLHRVVEQGDTQARERDRGHGRASVARRPDLDRHVAHRRRGARSDCAADVEAARRHPRAAPRAGGFGLGGQQHVGEHVVHHGGVAPQIGDRLVERLAALVPSLQDLDAAA